MKRVISAFFVATGTAAAVVLAPGTTVADVGLLSVGIDSHGNGAHAYFNSDGERLKACDLAGNGLRAVAVARWTGAAGVTHTVEVHDADGANGNCVEGNLDINDGILVQVSACERDGQYGPIYNCNSAQTRA